jgi:hypothetical protein
MDTPQEARRECLSSSPSLSSSQSPNEAPWPARRLHIAAVNAGIFATCVMACIIVIWDEEASSLGLLGTGLSGTAALVGAVGFPVAGLLTPKDPTKQSVHSSTSHWVTDMTGIESRRSYSGVIDPMPRHPSGHPTPDQNVLRGPDRDQAKASYHEAKVSQAGSGHRLRSGHIGVTSRQCA